MSTVYVYHHANPNAAEAMQPVEKGVADENDPTLIAWVDDQGNIAGWAKEDGTPNQYGSHVEAITNEQQFRLIENGLFELRVAVQCCHSGLNSLALLKPANWKTESDRVQRVQDIHIGEIAELEFTRVSILGEIFQDDMRKILGAFYADVRGSLNWSIAEAEEMAKVLDDETESITARGIELFEAGAPEIDFESAYNVLVPMYVSMSALQRLKSDATGWQTVEG